MTATAQAMQALKAGNVIRLERAEIRRQLRTRRSIESWPLAADHLEDPPRAILTMPVGQLLRACKSLQTRSLLAILAAADVPESLEIGRLSVGERESLARALRILAAGLKL